MLALILALSVSWNIGFQVTTAHPTNVVVRSKTTCNALGGPETPVTRQFEATTPIRRSVAPTVSDAVSCHIRVVSWDVKPWTGPHGNGAVPHVETWVTHT